MGKLQTWAAQLMAVAIFAGATATNSAAGPDEAAGPTATVDAFFAALSSGDLDAAEALLDPQVRIFESGAVESSAREYAAHHMRGDAALLGSATREVLARAGQEFGELAWVATRQRLTGTSRDKSVDIFSTETMVLRRTAGGWRIVHVHWSSRPATTD